VGGEAGILRSVASFPLAAKQALTQREVEHHGTTSAPLERSVKIVPNVPERSRVQLPPAPPCVRKKASNMPVLRIGLSTHPSFCSPSKGLRQLRGCEKLGPVRRASISPLPPCAEAPR
jgi:hypothetical protein